MTASPAELFEAALARLYVDSAFRQRFLKDPLTEARDMGLDETQAATLAKIDPEQNGGLSKEEGEARLTAVLGDIMRLQELLYAAQQTPLLIVLQGMDTSGKDGTIRSRGGISFTRKRAASRPSKADSNPSRMASGRSKPRFVSTRSGCGQWHHADNDDMWKPFSSVLL